MNAPSALCPAPRSLSAPLAPAKRRRSRGLTLIEVLLAIAVLGVLASIAIPNYSQYMERGRVAQAMGDMRTIELTIFRFSAEQNGRFPESLADIGVIQNDPWGRPYQYLNVVTTPNRGPVRKDRSLNPINTDYDLYSMGPDGRSVPPLTAAHSRDDIVRGRNGQFVGKATDF
jgi:general secretion pathway protein G